MVNARHVKTVPGRKTDVADAQWLAVLARAGLLRIIYAMLSKNQPYRDASVNYEELMVERNAPRWLKMLGKYGYLAPQQA